MKIKISNDFDRERVIDNETGIIRWLSEIPIEPGEPEIFNFSTEMANTGKYLPIRCYDKNGGAGLTKERARLAAIGEAIERYCASVYFRDDLILGSISEVSSNHRVLKPEEIAMFHIDQKNNLRYSWFTDDVKICWTSGTSITRNEPILVPACLVYVPYYPFFREIGEKTIGPSVSTGLASGHTYEDTLLRGMYEIIERDAFVITWLNKLPIPKIDLASSEKVSKIFNEKFRRNNLEYLCFNMTTDIRIPTVLCVLIDKSFSPPMICMGGACNVDPEQAVLKSLLEAAQTREWAKYLGKQDTQLIVESDYSNIDEFEKHVYLYAYGNMSDAIKFLTDNNKTISFSEFYQSIKNTQNELDYVLKEVHSKGYEVITIDLTSEDVKECGYYVLKVMIPLLQPLEGDHTHRFLGGNRLHTVPEIMRIEKSKSKTFNSYPHPYP